jgi:fructose-1,6-bisphosphatase/inositol monophosphatase family enzyme
VTAADRECERLLVQDICQHFPEDGILGEEGADKEATANRLWILDPIDGTRDFVRGNRLWSMFVALEEDGEVVVGVAHFPALGETYWAVKGGGAWRNGERIRVSEVTRISEAVLSLTTFTNVHRTGFHERLFAWLKDFYAVRSMGGALDAMFVCAGHADAWIEVSAKPWDLAPIKLIAEEAGALFFNFDGGDSIRGGNCVVVVPGLEAHFREFVTNSLTTSSRTQ